MNPIYGPVPSWRLGPSLGVDPISCKEKTCSFCCIYCQLGKTIHKTDKRQIFVNEKIIKEELKRIKNRIKADIVTLSGTGEPTLAKNLGKIIDIIRKEISLPIAILTNSSLIYRKDVQKDLKKLDFVIAKLDCSNAGLLRKINKPYKIKFERIINGVKSFKKQYKGKLALQMMFIDENKDYAKQMSALAKFLKPDEIQINTPLRPCPVKPLKKRELDKIKEIFKGFKVISVYDAVRPNVKIWDKEATLIRRPE
jgi:wyosine [tRNA(Phe)-imidazoG37] synthetase (radical SAM superfamily)